MAFSEKQKLENTNENHYHLFVSGINPHSTHQDQHNLDAIFQAVDVQPAQGAITMEKIQQVTNTSPFAKVKRVANWKKYHDKFAKDTAVNDGAIYETTLVVVLSHFSSEFYRNEEKAVLNVVLSYLNVIENHIARNRISSASEVIEAGLLFFIATSKKNINESQFNALKSGFNRLKQECFTFLRQQSHLLTQYQQQHLDDAANQSVFK